MLARNAVNCVCCRKLDAWKVPDDRPHDDLDERDRHADADADQRGGERHRHPYERDPVDVHGHSLPPASGLRDAPLPAIACR
jgi:hypothetical protein